MKPSLPQMQAQGNQYSNFCLQVRNYTSGGNHEWGEKVHAFRSGKGKSRDHWECTNPNCMFYADHHLFDTISQTPGCTRGCNNCGDWIFNCRQTCPNPSNKLKNSIGTVVLNSCHGTRLSAYPDGRLGLTVNNDAWQQWVWISVGFNKCFLMSYHGTFLGAHDNRSVYLAQSPREWETWTKEIHGNKHSYRSYHGTYLKGEPDGKVAMANARKEWEVWHH